MEISCSLKGIVNRERPRQGVADIGNAGFENIFLDLSLYCTPNKLENACEVPVGVVEGMLQQCSNVRIGLPIARAPYLRRNTKRTDLNDVLIESARESIEICSKADCKYIIIRPLFAGVDRGSEWEINREFYLALAETAREHQVMILLENGCRDLGGHLVRGICSDAIVAADWVDTLNQMVGEERFGFCMDVGVCNLCGQNMQEFAMNLGKRMKAVVLRDCDGRVESAGLPFTSVSDSRAQTDWLGLIRGLRESGFDGQLILDMSDTAAGFSSLLRPSLLSLAKGVADYFKLQIEMESNLKKYSSIVLFGAGNMCRNYMKCYGEKYPPLYTCDNNSKLWGTSFCGLEVKAPEVLKDLPEDCVVLICNTYYREIEAQLHEMGVKNIAFFNDEYMPSFYFERLKGV